MVFNIYNVLHSALVEEIIDARKSVEAQKTASGKFVYADGGLVIPVRNGTDIPRIKIPYITIDGDEHSSDDTIGNSFHEVTPFHQEIAHSGQIKKILDSDIHTLVNVLKTLSSESMSGALYGVVLSYDAMRLNPLHPMTAMMIANGTISLPERFTCIVYPYQEKRIIDRYIVDLYKPMIQDAIGTISQKKETPSISMSARNSQEQDIQDITVNEDKTIRLRESSSHIHTVMIPVQLATDGLTIPWYGMIKSEKVGGGYNSRNIFPFSSGNVQSHYLSGPGATCTGNHDNSMFGSLYVLSNMNIGSVYFSNCVPPESEHFVAACHEVSFAALNAYADNILKREQEAKKYEQQQTQSTEPEKTEPKSEEAESEQPDESEEATA